MSMLPIIVKLKAQGFTEDEVNAFVSTLDCANKILALPDIHPMDRGEYCSAFHVIQDKLLSRVAVKSIRTAEEPEIFGARA